MSTFKLYINKDANIEEDILQSIEDNHRTPQDEVIRIYVDKFIPKGFEIIRDDNMLESVVKSEKDNIDESKYQGLIRKQKAFLKEQARYSMDTSLTEGAKPYEPK